MRLKAAMLIILALGTTAWAQSGQRKDQATVNVNGYVKVLSGAYIKVCTYNVMIVCNATINIFSDPNLTLPLSNPFQADANGNFSYFAAPGNYIEQVSSPNAKTQIYAIALPTTTGTAGVTTTGSPASGEISTFSGANTITNGNISGDCTTTNTTGITCTKTNGTAFAASATTDTTNASNISSGTLSGSRMAQINLAASGNGGVGGFLGQDNLQFVNGTVNVHTYSGADICAKINAAMVANPEAILDAREFTGTQACASNPFASQAGDTVLLLGSGLTIQTTANWVTSSSWNTLIYGAGRGSNSRGTTIQAVGGFPSTCDSLATNNCAILRLGDGSGPVFGTRAVDLSLDCNGLSQCIGMYSTDLQEQTGMYHFQVINYSNIGILIDGSSNAGTGPFWAQNYVLFDGEVYALTHGTNTTIGLKLIGGNNSAGGETAPRLIAAVTASGNSGHAIGTAFQMEQWWGGELMGLNAENATNGYQFGVSKPMNGVSATNLRCANVSTSCVWITSNSPFSNNIVLEGIQNTTTVATNTIKDDQQSVNTLGSTDPTVGKYILGQGYSAGGVTSFNMSSATGNIQIPGLTLYNGADSAINLDINSGKTAAQGQSVMFQDRGTNEWTIQNTNGNLFQIFDNVGNLSHFIFNRSTGLTNLNSNSTGAVAINENTNSGTGGFQVWSGGATPVDNFVVGSTGSLSFGGGQTLTTSNSVPTYSTMTAGQAVCVKASGPPVQLGICASVVSAGGACTCN